MFLDAKQARDLIAVLVESKQKIDPRLQEMARYGGGGGGRSFGGGRGRGGGRGGDDWVQRAGAGRVKKDPGFPSIKLLDTT